MRYLKSTTAKKEATMKKAVVIPLVLTIGLVASRVASAADERDPADNTLTLPTILNPGHPPITRSMQASGSVADVDWFRAITRAYRSYEVIVSNPTDQTWYWSLERLDSSGTSVLQSWTGWETTNHSSGGQSWFGARHLRWQTSAFASTGDGSQTVRITGSSAFTNPTFYTIQFRETTLFCPRFNNTGSQVSVLIVQASLNGSSSCDFSAHFISEAGSLLGTFTGSFSESSGGVIGATTVISTPGVTGVAGQKGAARIAHTCGLGGITAKLVALEPSTGFSFDTPCTPPP